MLLQETKTQQLTRRTLLSTLSTDLDQHVALPTEGTCEGIMIAWSGTVLDAITTRMDEFSVSVLFDNLDGTQWWFSGVYSPQLDAAKILFLQEMRTLGATIAGPWLIAGDFNHY